VKLAIELKGDSWTQARVKKLRDVLKAKGMFSSRVNVHSFSSTYAGYAKTAGFADVGLAAPENGPLPSVTTIKDVHERVGPATLITDEKLQQYNAARIKVWIWTVIPRRASTGC
jgi:hypothetical protein